MTRRENLLALFDGSTAVGQELRDLLAEVTRLKQAEIVLAAVIDVTDKHGRALHFATTTPENIAALVDAICETDSRHVQEKQAAERDAELQRQFTTQAERIYIAEKQAKELAEAALREAQAQLEEAERAVEKVNAIRNAELQMWMKAAQAHRGAEWQPIASAPKQMDAVLLYWPYWSKEPVIGERNYTSSPDDEEIVWFDSWHTERWLGEDSDDPGPTHWMPLPAPPAPDAAPGSTETP